MVNGALLPNGTLGEDVGLSLELLFVIQHFQRAEQIIGRIIRERQPIRPVVDQSILGGISVVKRIQFRLSCLYGIIAVFV